MKKIVLILSVAVISLCSKAQQDLQLTHFMFDKLSINPGFAGTNDAICLTGIFRNQWSGLGANPPKDILLNVHAPIQAIRGGLGLTFYNDQLGYLNTNNIKLAYSYHYKGLGPGVLGIGASLGYQTTSYNANWITPTDPVASDAAIGSGSEKASTPNFGFGLYYAAKNFYGGLSTTQLSESELTSVSIKNVRHYYFQAGYTYNIMSDLALKPNVLVKSDFVATQFDLNLLVMYKEMIYLGVTYRNQDAIAPMIGLQHSFNKAGTIKLGYAYDLTTSTLKNYSSGTHEVMLNYCFNISTSKPLQRSKHPLFL